MAWQVSSAELVDDVASGRDHVREHRSWRTLEALARGLRWVEELDESQRLFDEAAVDVIERIERPGRGSAASHARTAGFFALAGEPEASREWGVRAADEFVRQRSEIDGELLPRAAESAVATLYVCGERGHAVSLARQLGVRPPAAELAEA